MKNKRITIKAWQLCKWLAVYGFFFWAAETTYFLIVEGWHYAATSEAEKICDSIVEVMWRVALLLFSFVLAQIVQFLLSIQPK